MNAAQFDQLIVVPALTAIGLISPASRVLMLGTAMMESDLEYLEQTRGGPGMGLFQIEDATYKDILRYLNTYDKAKLKETCLSAAFYVAWPSNNALIHNLRWATIVARIKYEMQPEGIPYSFDYPAMASYYKKYYNTAEGAADIEKAVGVFSKAGQIIAS